MSSFGIKAIQPLGVDGELMPFGPVTAQFFVMRAPSRAKRLITFTSGVQLEVECFFSGERLEIESLRVTAPKNQILTTKMLTQLGLPVILNKIFLESSPTTKSMTKLPDRDDLSKEQFDSVLTQVYWFEYASWGNPRQRVTQYTQWSNNNANAHFRRLAKLHGLPGSHAGKLSLN
jgi:hypothetical protein